jgi:hypothetical protein
MNTATKLFGSLTKECDSMRYGPLVGLLLVLSLVLAPTAIASTTWYVNGVSGSDTNNCLSAETACKTIGHAVSLAASGDAIMVAAATHNENLTIGISLAITGAGARTTIVDGGGVNRVVTIPKTNTVVTLSNLTIRHGLTGWSPPPTGCGGGIYNIGTLTINGSTISGNRVNGFVEVLGLGGGICNGGRLTINTTTISGNTITKLGLGAGIYNFGGTLTINRSTISENTARRAGGIRIDGGTVVIDNSTISGNGYNQYGLCSGIDGGPEAIAINNTTISRNIGPNGGAGFCATTTMTIQNSIVANNSGRNCDSGVTSHGYNLSSDGTCDFNGPGDMNNTEPLLGPLQNNGGPTETIAELEGSLTIDAGNPSGCRDSQGHLLKIDQRGYPRPGKDKHDHRCDMGAYESQTD